MIIPGMDCDMGKATKPLHFGLWLFRDETIFPECTECGKGFTDAPSNYCGNCGAVMVNVVAASSYYMEVVKTIMESSGRKYDGK